MSKVEGRKDLQKAATSHKTRGVFFQKVFVGAFIGFVNGLFGGGGGMLCVPLLERVLKMPTKRAHASTIGIIFPISIFSACVYVFEGSVLSQPLLFVLMGSVIGGLVGAFLLKLLPEKVISIIFSVLMIFMGVRLII